MHFSELALSAPILRALDHQGYTTPTPIQAQAIPHALAGRDVLGCAQTGTGKTAAFALPILHRLSTAAIDKTHRGTRKARALILSPTRELAEQIADSFTAYGRDTGLSNTTIYGGVSQSRQERALARGVDIIVATPGRLIDLMEQRIVDLSGIQILVLDEADRMLDMGFIQPIRRIASATPAGGRQTLLFSATMPGEIVKLAHSLLRDPVRVSVTPVSSVVPIIEQGVFMIDRFSKQSLLEALLSDKAATPVTRALVFTRTKHGAERVGKNLARAGIITETIHGNKSQPQRRRALDRFSTGRARVLVATDVAARGLDVDDISHVVNFDIPVEPEAYIHRIGRTGRAGATGIALSFCDREERGLLKDIERLLGKQIRVETAIALPKPAAHTAGPVYGSANGSGHTPQRASDAPHDGAEHGHRAPAPRANHHGGSGQHPTSGGHRGHRAPNHRSHPKPGGNRGWHKPSRRGAGR